MASINAEIRQLGRQLGYSEPELDSVFHQLALADHERKVREAAERAQRAKERTQRIGYRTGQRQGDFCDTCFSQKSVTGECGICD